VRNQWRVGMAGRDSLDFAAVRGYLLDKVPNPRKRRQVWDCIVACAEEQSSIWAEERERAQAQQNQNRF